VYLKPGDGLFGSWGGIFTQAEYVKLEKPLTNGWENWAANNGVTPQNKYVKFKVSFTNNYTRFNLIKSACEFFYMNMQKISIKGLL
jgi:hypothetical protein